MSRYIISVTQREKHPTERPGQIGISDRSGQTKIINKFLPVNPRGDVHSTPSRFYGGTRFRHNTPSDFFSG